MTADRIAQIAFFAGALLVLVALLGFAPEDGAGIVALVPALVAPLVLVVLAGTGLSHAGRPGGTLHTAMRSVTLALAGIFAASTASLLYFWVR